MSKKIAAGSDKILLEVTCGSGAFMESEVRARVLAQTMVNIGKLAGKETIAVLTNMNQPLGKYSGNALERIGWRKTALIFMSIHFLSCFLSSPE